MANKAIIHTLLGNFEHALALFESTRGVWLRRGQTDSVLLQDLLVAKLHIAQGRYTRALKLLADIRSTWERMGHRMNAGLATLNMVDCYLGLNRDAEAAGLSQEAGLRFDDLGTPAEGSRARLLAAVALSRLGDEAQALALLENAAATCVRAGLATQLALVSLQRARLSLRGDDRTVARAEALRARDLFADQGLVLRRAEAEVVAARAALLDHDLGEAEALATSSCEASELKGAHWIAHESHYVLGRVARLRGQPHVALAECERAVASIEQVQSRLAPELRSHFLDDKVQVFREAVETALDVARPERALGYLERAKSRALVDYLAINREVAIRPRHEANRELIDELSRLRDEHNWLSNRLNGYGSSQTGEYLPRPAELPALQEEVRDREVRIARLLEQVTLQDDDRVEGLAGAVPVAPGVPVLPADTVLLEYFFHEDGGCVFVVRSGGVVAVPLEVDSAEVQRHLFRWQLSLDASARALVQGQPLAPLQRNALGVLQRLYRALLAPVESQLDGARRIVVVPYGAGHAVPWHALHDGLRYLVERAEVWSCPSISLLSLVEKRRKTASERSVVFAYGQNGALPHVQSEADSVASVLGAEVFSGERASRTALKSVASGCKVLHLAAHGAARLDDPTFAHLQLADGQLAAADVFNLSLNGALVTLSACETGRAVVTGGDELIGLSRGFLFAGAAALVQSLWRVEDESTATLMGRFYGELGRGRTVAEALRLAQLALLYERDGLPYLWAPFQVIGDGGWRLGVPGRS